MITVVSVSYLSKDYLDYNFIHLKKISSGNLDWLIVNNSPQEEQYCFPCRVLPGVKQEEVPASFVNKHSYHHAAGLDIAIPHVNTRFVLFMDADFFMFVDPNKIVEHMIDNDVHVFGAGYYPDGKNRIMGVPVAFNMLVDTQKVCISQWSFRPTGVEKSGLIGDTGINIYKEIQDQYHYEVAKPESTGSADIYSWKNKLYGVHSHAKLHLRENSPFLLKQRIKQHLDEVKKYATFI